MEQHLPSLLQTIEFDEGAGAVLRIQPLRAPRDENIYECVAENVEGEITVNAKLSIIRGESGEDVVNAEDAAAPGAAAPLTRRPRC